MVAALQLADSDEGFGSPDRIPISRSFKGLAAVGRALRDPRDEASTVPLE